MTKIAFRKNQGTGGGRPPHFDASLYRERNVAERAFNRPKGWRGVATRYETRPQLPRRHRRRGHRTVLAQMTIRQTRPSCTRPSGWSQSVRARFDTWPLRGLWTSEGEGPGDNRRIMIRVWEYDVQGAAAADFERIYGADGAWAQLFSSSDGFEGTELFASVSNSGGT